MVRIARPLRILRGMRHGPLARPVFRLLIVGVFTSSIGDLCYAVALPRLILSSGGGSVRLGTVLAGSGVSRAGGIPVGGVLTDRLGPRPVMLGADFMRCGAMCALGVQTLAGKPVLAVLLAIAVVQGIGGGLFQPASLARVPELVPEDELAAGNGIDSAVGQLGNLLGPAVGGVLVSTVGVSAAIAIPARSASSATEAAPDGQGLHDRVLGSFQRIERTRTADKLRGGVQSAASLDTRDGMPACKRSC